MVNPFEYQALVAARIVDGLEAYVATSKPMIRIGGSGEFIVVARNYGDINRVKKVQVFLNREGHRTPIYEDVVEFPAGETRVVRGELPLPEKPGRHMVELLIDGKHYDTAAFMVDEPSARKQLLISFVWHHHQAPNYTVDGKIHSPWAYIYVWGSHLSPYGLGPYHFHAELLMRKPWFKSTYNLSPSLLEQWRMAIERGVEFVTGEKYAPESPEVARLRETLDMYREAARRGQIDVLTSIYAHTIAGYLAEVLEMSDVVEEELAYGKQVTEEVMGGGYRPPGFWTPEMAFSMRLVDIYERNGIEYTVLDDRHHFSGATGEKNGPREPYLLVDPVTGSHITVFFRDHVLSDILGFHNNFLDEPHSWRNAYETALRIVEQWYDSSAKTLVLALDGENWMVFPKNPPQTAYYLDRLTDFLGEVAGEGFIELATLRDALEKHPPRRVLKHIPLNSWLGTFRKWRGEVRDHEEMWFRAVASYRMIRGYERAVARDQYSRGARWALWHALDSDYWWAEFWKPDTIEMWLRRVDELVGERLRRLKVMVEPIGDYTEGADGLVNVVVRNGLDVETKPVIMLCGTGVVSGEEAKPTVVKPGSTYTRTIRVRFTKWGHVSISASIVADGYVVDTDTKAVWVKPHLPPNPF